MKKPRIGLTLGDPNGIGAEIVAKLLAQPDILAQAEIVIIGDADLFRMGERIADVSRPIRVVAHLSEITFDDNRPLLFNRPTLAPQSVTPGRATSEAGGHVLQALSLALQLAQAQVIDALCFAPLNKHAMHLANSPFEDELRFFAHQLDHDGPVGELNVLGDLWTARVTSHVPLKEVAELITADAVCGAIQLVDGALRNAGYTQPRIAVAGLNPHAGENGSFGREEIEQIDPGVRQAQAQGIDAAGPFPSDTVFLKARVGDYDAVVTMYHDQGQIAMKLMGFERGITVQGGLPIPITTPAHGTAFDIVGQGKANVSAIRQAFLMACRMASSRG